MQINHFSKNSTYSSDTNEKLTIGAFAIAPSLIARFPLLHFQIDLHSFVLILYLVSVIARFKFPDKILSPVMNIIMFNLL